ncbi:MAG: glycosyltransferase [Acidobacteriota bacterium]|nr:glycosyltransferase [Acidobacteriota bacterium]
MLLQFPNPFEATSETPQNRPAILLMVYDCAPEVSAGWMRVVDAAQEFDVHAIVSAESLATIEGAGRAAPLAPAIRFHTPRLDAVHRALTRLGATRDRNPLAYRHWQHLAFRQAQALHRVHCFSLVHQVNLDGVVEPGFAWRLGIPFVWGPADGTERVPAAFLSGMTFAEQIAERARALRVRLALGGRHVRQASRQAAVLLAAHSGARQDFERIFRRPLEVLPAAGLASVQRPETARFRGSGPLRLLWAGTFAQPDSLPLLLEAIANLGHDVNYRLHILGAGPLEAEWKALASEMGVRGRCTFLGDPGALGLAAQLGDAHLLVSTRLRGGPCGPILEALGRGVPVMCFDQHAAGDIVTSACGLKIALTHPGQAVAGMASALRALAQDRTPLLRLSAGACDRARNFLWRENSARMLAIYNGLVLASPVAAARTARGAADVHTLRSL